MDGTRHEDLRPSDVVSVARLFKVAESPDATTWWREEELYSILEHQLNVPMSFELRESTGAGSGYAESPPGQTFRDLLSAAQPSLQLLQRLKEFAKSSDTRAQNPLPTPVALVLYYWSILAARIRCSAKISGMSEKDLRRGILWVTRQAWLDEPTRQFFSTALDLQI